MRKHRFFTGIILLCFLIAAALGGCSGEKQAPAPGANAGNQQAATEPAKPQPSAKPSNSSEEWMPWAGPKTLGPEKPLPMMWCLTLTHCYKTGYGYVIQANFKGEWYDDTIRKKGGQLKGILTADELASVKKAAGPSTNDITLTVRVESPPGFNEVESLSYRPGIILPDLTVTGISMNPSSSTPGEP
ncbi:MAG: hypothetical protein C4589_09280 [Peptococcaceae bacterium]|nr:MAG: hypothetical protein C4589_09280 [Peptococcaceae bacterium]